MSAEERVTGNWENFNGLELILLQDGQGFMSVIRINEGTVLEPIEWEIEHPGELTVRLDEGVVRYDYELSNGDNTLTLGWGYAQTVYQRVS